jgi:ABC-type transport system involved in Fe-S cluster assembly fused permease/ATPase subunit
MQNAIETLREALRLLWSIADGYAKRRVLLALALVLIAALLTAATPLALKLVIDAFTDPTGGVQYFAPISLVVLYVASQYLWRCATELRTMLHGYAEQRLERKIGRRLFEHLMRLPLQFHLDRKVGAMGETVQQGTRGYQLLLQHLIYTILPTLAELGLVAIVLFRLGHEIYLVVIVVSGAAYAFAFNRGARAVRDSAASVSASQIDAQAVLTDSLLNQETVKYFDADRIVCERYDATLGRTELAWRSFFRARTVNGMLVASVFAASLGISLVYAARGVEHGTMTVGDFVLVNAYILRLVQPLELLGLAVRDVAQGMAFLASMLALLREKTEPDAASNSAAASSRCGALTFRNVSFSYRQERTILHDVSFTVPAGRTTAVVGVSGSGKSSLIRLLFRLYEPDVGQILLDGVAIADLGLSEVRNAIAVVPQDTVLFHDTVANNIGFGRNGATQREIEHAARVANLHDFILTLPDGYDTLVGERGLKFSGGERQRVAIARAALKKPRVLVFDEATSSLDSRTERQILRNLMDLSSQTTTLVIAHRLSTVVHADEILVLDHGVVVERGTHARLRALNGHYAALWNAQQSATPDRTEA